MIYEKTVPVEVINIIEEEVEVPVERIIERPVEKIVERHVEVIFEIEVEEDDIVEEISYKEKIV